MKNIAKEYEKMIHSGNVSENIQCQDEKNVQNDDYNEKKKAGVDI